MKTSERINEIAAALAAAQGQFLPVKKSGKNLHLKTPYSTLDDVLGAVGDALSANDLAIVQSLNEGDLLTTMLMHSSGQYIQSTVAIPSLDGNRGVNALQAFGSAVTYMKRYAISALLAVSSDTDDDAQSQEQVKRQPRQRQRSSSNKVARPMSPDFLRDALRQKAEARGDSGSMPATDKQAPFVAQKFTEALLDQSNPTEAYHLALGWLWDVTSAKDLTLAQAKATLDWLLWGKGPDETGDTPLHEHAPEEASRVLRAALKAQGQSDMFEGDES